MKKHSAIDVVFSLLLLLLFVCCSFLLLVFGAKSYKTGIESQSVRENTQIPLAYITTRIHQAKNASCVQLQQMGDIDVLVIDFDVYDTYIYAKDRVLYELVQQKDSLVDLDSGTKLYTIDSYGVSYESGVYSICVNGVCRKVGVK